MSIENPGFVGKNEQDSYALGEGEQGEIGVSDEWKEVRSLANVSWEEHLAAAHMAHNAETEGDVVEGNDVVRNKREGDGVGEVEQYGGNETSIALRRQRALERIAGMEMSDEELLRIGEHWGEIEVDEEALSRAQQFNASPNAIAPGLIVGSGKNLPMNENSVYRHVGSSAIRDLMEVGFVRSKRAAAGAEDLPGKIGFGTNGVGVYWNGGVEGKSEIADLVIEASKEKAAGGYVRVEDVKGIWVTDAQTGDAVNLLDMEQPAIRDGTLKMGKHKV